MLLIESLIVPIAILKIFSEKFLFYIYIYIYKIRIFQKKFLKLQWAQSMTQSRASFIMFFTTVHAPIYDTIIAYKNKHTTQTRKNKLVIQNISINLK